MRRARVREPALLVVGIVCVGFIRRGPIVAVAPITRAISNDLSLTAAQAGLLTSLPVLCFALVAPFASLFVGKAGANFATTVAIVGVGIDRSCAQQAARRPPSRERSLWGLHHRRQSGHTVIIRRDISEERVGIVTGAYTSAMNVSSMITSLATVPLAIAFGWRGALLAWLGFVVGAAVAWLVAVGPANALRWDRSDLPSKPGQSILWSLTRVASPARPRSLARGAICPQSSWRSRSPGRPSRITD